LFLRPFIDGPENNMESETEMRQIYYFKAGTKSTRQEFFSANETNIKKTFKNKHDKCEKIGEATSLSPCSFAAEYFNVRNFRRKKISRFFFFGKIPKLNSAKFFCQPRN